MNTTVDELKALYTSLGGSAEDVVDIVTIPDMIAALANVAGSTIELPAVSDSDDGDVLTVVDGKWAKAEASGGLPAAEVADAGKFLAVNESGVWDKADAPSGGELYWHTVALTAGGVMQNATCVILNTTSANITVNDIKTIVNDGGKVLLTAGNGTSSGNAVVPIFISKSDNPDVSANVFYYDNAGQVYSAAITWNSLVVQEFGTDSHKIL